jgi:hypothetical protein
METSNKLTGEQLNRSISSAVDTPANHLVPLGNDKEQTTLDTCGHGYGTPLANYDPATQSWKMCVDICLWGQRPSLENLPKSGMTQNGVLYQQPEWVRLIDANESLLWPTPTYGKLAGGTGGMQQIEAKYLAGVITTEERRAMRAGNGGKLNPAWIEWLMGFPIGWTDLED